MKCPTCNKDVKSGNKFCNSSCAAIHNNENRIKNGYSVKNKTKEVACIECGLLFQVGINSSNYIRCKNCASRHNTIVSKMPGKAAAKIVLSCILCGASMFGLKTRKYCDTCLSNVRSENSRKTILLQGAARRSKNEIYFAELCQNYFGEDNIKINNPMFDGWDADVIVDTIKVAVLWNGKWHYEKIASKHSVAQVQNRDRIKLEKIKAYNYIPYVIKDLGKFNKQFVYEEFTKFCKIMGV